VKPFRETADIKGYGMGAEGGGLRSTVAATFVDQPTFGRATGFSFLTGRVGGLPPP
jgi:hypothetical protein